MSQIPSPTSTQIPSSTPIKIPSLSKLSNPTSLQIPSTSIPTSAQIPLSTPIKIPSLPKLPNVGSTSIPPLQIPGPLSIPNFYDNGPSPAKIQGSKDFVDVKVRRFFGNEVSKLSVYDLGGNGHCGPACLARFIELTPVLMRHHENEIDFSYKSVRKKIAEALEDLTNINSSKYWEDNEWFKVAELYDINVIIFRFYSQQPMGFVIIPAGARLDNLSNAASIDLNKPAIFLLNTEKTKAHPYAHYQLLFNSLKVPTSDRMKPDDSHSMWIQTIENCLQKEKYPWENSIDYEETFTLDCKGVDALTLDHESVDALTSNRESVDALTSNRENVDALTSNRESVDTFTLNCKETQSATLSKNSNSNPVSKFVYHWRLDDIAEPIEEISIQTNDPFIQGPWLNMIFKYQLYPFVSMY
jgi:hypothetical protein